MTWVAILNGVQTSQVQLNNTQFAADEQTHALMISVLASSTHG